MRAISAFITKPDPKFGIFKKISWFWRELRFATTFTWHTKATKAKWYRNWHQFKYSHHIHTAVLAGYVFAISASLIFNTLPTSQIQQAEAAASTATQTTFAGTGDGTYTNALPANGGADVALNPVFSNAGGSGWQYKRPITVTNSSGSTVTGYQVGVTPFTDSTFINNTGLVGSWHLNGGTSGAIANGTTVGFEDLSGNNNPGTASNANGTGLAWATGKFSGGTVFDNVDDSVNVPNSSSLTMSSAFSISAWIKTTSATGMIFSKDNGTTPWAGYAFGVGGNSANGKLSIWYGNGNNWDYSTSTVNDGNWHYVAVTFDGSNSKFYIDNALNATVPKTGTVSINSSANAMIGADITTTGRSFNGTLDEVRVYNRVITGPATNCTASSANETCQQYGTAGVPKVRADYADLRFANAVTGVEYPYWQESDGKYWVKVLGTIPTGTSANMVNMYYGNASATSSSSGASTFNVFDDFSDGLLSGSPTWAGVQGTWYANTYAANATSTGTPDAIKTYIGVTQTYRIGGTLKNGSAGGLMINTGYSTRTSGYGIYLAGTAYNFYKGAASAIITNTRTNDTNIHTFEFTKGAGGSFNYYYDGTNKGSITDTTYPNANYLILESHGTATNYFDNIRVGQYITNEPTFGAPGSEVSAYNTTGSFITAAQAPTGVYNWGALTYTKTTPGTSTITVDVLNGNTDATISSNVSSGTNLNLSGVTYPSLKLKFNYATSNIGEIPTVSDWSLAYSYDLTAPVAPLGSGLTTSSVTSTSVVLSWSAATDTESGVVGYEIQRAPDSGGSPGSWGAAGGTCTGVIAATTCTDSGLSGSTKYYYRVRSKDLAGLYSPYTGVPGTPTAQTVNGSAFTGADWGPDYLYDDVDLVCVSDYADESLSTFDLSAYGGGVINSGSISWTFSATNGGADKSGSRYLKRTDTGATLQTWAASAYPTSSSAAGIVTFLEAKKGSTAQFYWASDAGQCDIDKWSVENGLANPQIQFSYTSYATPANVTTLSAGAVIGTTTVDASGPIVHWTEPSPSTGFTYAISRYLGNGTLDVANIKTGLTAGTNSWQDSAANDPSHVPALNTSYKYTVTSTNGGVSTESDLSNAVSTYPGAPTAITPTANANGSVSVAWNNPTNGAASYTIYRSTSGGSTGSSIATGQTTSPYTDSTAAFNTTYYYTVSAVNASGATNSTQTAGTLTYPGAPTAVTPTANANGSVSVAWSNPTNGAASYTIYRSTSGGSTGSSIATGQTTSPYTDGTAQANTTYYYTVAAVNATGSTNSAQSSGKLTYPLAPTIGTTTVNLTGPTVNWTEPVINSGLTYSISRYLGTGVLDVANIKTGLSAGTNSWQDSAANDPSHVPVPNTSYKYVVSSVNATATVDSSQSNTVKTYTAAPTLATPTVISATQINLSWSVPTGGVDHYHLYRNGAKVEIPSGTTYSDTSLSPNTSYSYLVVGMNGTDGVGVEGATSATLAKYTFAQPPSVTGDKTIGGWSKTSDIVFTNNRSFGSGGVEYYRYFWDKNASYTFNDLESQWSAGTHSETLTSGPNYLHLKAYNFEGVSSGTLHLGPYNLDTVAPTGQITIGSTNYSNNQAVTLNLTASDAASGIYQMRFSNSGLPLEWSAWEAYSTTKAGWDMTNITYGGTSDQGTKTVYVEFSDNALNTVQASDTVFWDGINPTNPTTLTGHKTSSAWDAITNPSFSWSGATDPDFSLSIPGSGLKGYWVYFGTDSSANPKTSQDAGNLAYVDNGNKNLYTDLAYTVSSTIVSGQTYYLKVQAVDNALNDASSTFIEGQNLFVYKFDNDNPAAPGYIDVTPPGLSTTDSFNFSWPAAVDKPVGTNAGICHYYYKRENGTDGWTDNGVTRTISNLQKYRSGANRLDVKAEDCAGNESLTVIGTYYFSDPAALVPQNLSVDTSQSSGGTVNNFKFTWDGVAGATRYYFASNANPSETSHLFNVGTLPIDTTITVGEGTAHLVIDSSGNVELGPFASATQSGPNDFRLVAEDGGGNANWATPATASYSINTIAPAAPQSLTITDASNRSASMYALTVMWPPISSPTPDFDGYVVERSTDGAVFAPTATVKTNIYSEAGLTEGQRYYYRVRSKDNTGTTSGGYASGDRIPTGKYTVPPTITNDPVAEVKATSVNISWHTNRSSNSIVQFGPGNGYGQEISSATSYVFDHSIDLNGLTPGVTYHYRVASIDKDYDYSEDSAFSKDYTFTTLQAPGISNVTTSEVRLYSAIVTWKTTSSATSRILYGTTSAYGKTYEDNSGSQTTTHTVKLDNLSESTTYHYKIQGIDVDGNILTSDDYEFETLTFPKITGLKLSQVPNTPTSTVKVEFDSNVPTSSLVSFVGNRGKEVAKYDLETSHVLQVTGLADNTSYSVVVKGRDQYGNETLPVSTSYKTDFDTRPPYITNITVETSIVGYGVDAKGQLVISWTTDEPSTSQVEYGTGVGGTEYSNRTQEDTSLTENHVVIISDLKPSSPYHFRVISKDSSGNTGKSADNSVLTEEASQSVIDLIIKSLQSSIGWIFNAFGGGR